MTFDRQIMPPDDDTMFECPRCHWEGKTKDTRQRDERLRGGIGITYYQCRDCNWILHKRFWVVSGVQGGK